MSFKKEILIHVITWMNLKSIMVSKITQIQRKILFDSTFMRLHNNQIIETEGRTVITRECGRGGNGELLLNGTEFSTGGKISSGDKQC